MRILWLTWKDRAHPLAGGAEIVNEELAKRLARDGHEVIFLVGGFTNAPAKDARDGFSIVRVGSRYSVYWHAFFYYQRFLSDWPDIVIDEMNTVPFFAKLYAKQKNIMFVHQLSRKIWWYEMTFPLNLLGYLGEPFYLWILSDREVITISESTKKDLMRFGFKSDRIRIISEGIEIDALTSLEGVKKFDKPTVLALGAIRAMKRTLDIIKAFEIAKAAMPDLELIVAGKLEGLYGLRVYKMIQASPYKDSIRYLGPVNLEQKVQLLGKSRMLVSASVKEGWGLVITEANSQGTPAVVYDADGLRDSVRNGETGLIARENSPKGLSWAIAEIFKDPVTYERMRENAWKWSKEITFDKSYQQFVEIMQL